MQTITVDTVERRHDSREGGGGGFNRPRTHLDYDSTTPPLRRVDGAHATVREVMHVLELLKVEVELHL